MIYILSMVMRWRTFYSELPLIALVTLLPFTLPMIFSPKEIRSPIKCKLIWTIDLSQNFSLKLSSFNLDPLIYLTTMKMLFKKLKLLSKVSFKLKHKEIKTRLYKILMYNRLKLQRISPQIKLKVKLMLWSLKLKLKLILS